MYVVIFGERLCIVVQEGDVLLPGGFQGAVEKRVFLVGTKPTQQLSLVVKVHHGWVM